MSNIYSTAEFTRKMNIQKNDLWKDGFYSDRIIARKKIVLSEGGVYNRNAITVYVDTVISGLAENGPIFTVYDNEVETIDGDVRFTTKTELAPTISAASELWLGCIFNSDGSIKYSTNDNIINYSDESNNIMISEDGNNLTMNQTSAKLTGGIMYQINSSRDTLFGFDQVFILKIAGMASL